MHALTIFYMMSLGVEAGNLWRALAVAALAVSAFVLKQYWQSLGSYTRRARILIVMLRGAALLLLVCALAGVRLNYESMTPGRVLVRYAENENVSAAQGSAPAPSVEEITVGPTVAALRRAGFEPVAATEASATLRPEQQESFAAAILLTDGALRAADARREIERAQAAAGGAPVYVVTDPQPSAGPTVSVESVMMQGRRVRGVPITLRCVVHGRGMRGHESLLTISDTARVQASSRVTWNSDDEWQTITLEVVPKVAGWMDYVARIEPAGMVDDADSAALLSRPLTMYVENSRLRVLFFEGEPTWEAKFVRRALDQSGLFDLDYFAQVSRAATVGATTEEAQQGEGTSAGQPEEANAGKANNAVASPEAKLHAALRSAMSLNAYDAIIVGATPNAMLSAAEAAHLSSFVERRGGGLVIMGGNSFSGSAPAPGGRLYGLMPADVDPRGLASETQQVSRGAPLEAEKTRGQTALVPTEAGALGPLRGYLSASEGRLTAALTGQGLSLRGLRPGASVLASAGQSGATGASSNSSSSAGVPLIASMRYGLGRVLVFAPADSWRIRTSASGAQDDTSGPFGALWQGIALWTAEGARPPVEIVLDDESPAAGQPVTAEIRVRDQSFASMKIDRVKARLQPLAEDTSEAAATTSDAPQPQEILFQPDERDASVWRARFIAPPQRGRFSLEADYVANGESGSAEMLFGVVERTRMETGAANDTLRRASRERGGELFTAAEINTLLERLATHPSNTERVQRTWELRTWPPLPFLLILLLSGEWLTRRMKSKDEGGRMKDESRAMAGESFN
jgi:hypothetical protein